jgi:hypothetical protein
MDCYLNRWTQPDRIISEPYNPQTWNRFSYVGDNPISFNDPSGQMPTQGCGEGYSACAPTQQEINQNAQKLAILQAEADERKCKAGNDNYCSTALKHPGRVAAFTALALVGSAVAETFLLEGGVAITADAAISAFKSGLYKAFYTCVSSYACAKIMAKVTGITLYRVWGGDPNQAPEGFSGPWGSSWSPIDPRTIGNYRVIAGLPDEANLGRFLSIGKISDIEGIMIKSAEQIGDNIGGLLEYKFLDPALPALNIYLQRVLGINPPF